MAADSQRGSGTTYLRSHLSPRATTVGPPSLLLSKIATSSARAMAVVRFANASVSSNDVLFRNVVPADHNAPGDSRYVYSDIVGADVQQTHVVTTGLRCAHETQRVLPRQGRLDQEICTDSETIGNQSSRFASGGNRIQAPLSRDGVGIDEDRPRFQQGLGSPAR
jgi:hypothetical protein